MAPTAAVDAAHARVGPDTVVKVLFTSGYAESAIDGGLLDGLAGNLLSKPYRKEELARKLREVMEPKEGDG